MCTDAGPGSSRGKAEEKRKRQGRPIGAKQSKVALMIFRAVTIYTNSPKASAGYTDRRYGLSNNYSYHQLSTSRLGNNDFRRR